MKEELNRRIKKIEIEVLKAAKEILAGQHLSIFKNRGIEFEELREYSEGDDIRYIDWNVTARQNKTYVRKFREENEISIFLLIDLSGSTLVGRKRDAIAEIVATLALSAAINNDRVGAIFFTDKAEHFIRPMSGKEHAFHIISKVLNFIPNSKCTNIRRALEQFITVQKKGCLLFIISDFLDEGYEDMLSLAARKYDTVGIKIKDVQEKSLCSRAIFHFEDSETGECKVLNNLKGAVALAANYDYFKDMVVVDPQKDVIKPIFLFLKRRAKQK